MPIFLWSHLKNHPQCMSRMVQTDYLRQALMHVGRWQGGGGCCWSHQSMRTEGCIHFRYITPTMATQCRIWTGLTQPHGHC